MTNVLGRLFFAALAALAANAGFHIASGLDREAEVWRQLASLANEVPMPVDATGAISWLPTQWQPADVEGGRQKATGDYWLAQYDDLVRTRGGDPDPAVMHIAANAAYRLARRQGDVGTAAATRLDGVIEAYAAVLKADGTHPDAAWNYEFVARTRDILARARIVGPRRASATSPGLAPPSPNRSVHGAPGAPPPEAKGEEFETIAPMDFGDREAQPEPTPGTTIKRKG